MKSIDYKLVTACIDGNIKSIKDCLSKGANINVSDTLGQTPIIFAMKNNHVETVNFLIDCGADVNVVAKDGYNIRDIFQNPKRLLDAIFK